MISSGPTPEQVAARDAADRQYAIAWGQALAEFWSTGDLAEAMRRFSEAAGLAHARWKMREAEVRAMNSGSWG